MSTYLDNETDVRVIDLTEIVQRFIEMFDEIDGSPLLIADEDEVTDLLNDAAIALDCDYDGDEA